MTETIRRTPRQEAILKVIQNTDCHPTAEWIYQQLRPQFPRLSLATVYRTIAQLRAEGQLVSVGVVNNQERLDGNVTPHTHFICHRCGCVQDLWGCPHDDSLDAGAAACLGGLVQGHTLTFYGLCADCVGSENK